MLRTSATVTFIVLTLRWGLYSNLDESHDSKAGECGNQQRYIISESGINYELVRLFQKSRYVGYLHNWVVEFFSSGIKSEIENNSTIFIYSLRQCKIQHISIEKIVLCRPMHEMGWPNCLVKKNACFTYRRLIILPLKLTGLSKRVV